MKSAWKFQPEQPSSDILDLWYSIKSDLSNSTSNSSKLNSTRRKLDLEFLVGLATSLLFDSCLTWMNILLKCRCTALGCLLSQAVYFIARCEYYSGSCVWIGFLWLAYFPWSKSSESLWFYSQPIYFIKPIFGRSSVALVVGSFWPSFYKFKRTNLTDLKIRCTAQRTLGVLFKLGFGCLGNMCNTT